MLLTKLVQLVYRGILGPAPIELDRSDSRGTIFVLDGIGGLNLCAMSVRYMVSQIDQDVHAEEWPWCHGVGHWYRDLIDRTNVEYHAWKLANRVSNEPGSCFLIGKSGGCGVVVRALELIPPARVERVALLAPALSSHYDLTPALAAVRTTIDVYWSPLDIFLLGVGTTLLGTIDRVHGRSAGLTGFRTPGLNRSQRQTCHTGKVRQYRWTIQMAPTGYLGGHIGTDSPWFLRSFVLPRLLSKPDHQPIHQSSQAESAPISLWPNERSKATGDDSNP